jgi:cellulose synthase/poly-beta-1,6-N-acetylglucosamine synthase-like glycosyltransferase
MPSRKKPKVSVLMPCYNAGETLPEALESLACQTLADFEIVVVDDGSEDGTPEILRSWAARDPRLRVIGTPHRGIVAALQTGLDECRAPLVARMDADDRSLPGRLEQQLAFMDSHPMVAAAGCLVRAIPPNQVRQGFAIYLEWQNALVSDEDIRREIFVESPFAHPSVVFRRQAVEQAGGYQDHGWPEDYDLWLRLYLTGERFGKVPEVLLEWRESPARLTRADSRYSLENFLRAKAHYLALGPLAGRGAVIVWGAGMMGRRLSKHLAREVLPLVAFVDIDPRKIGHSRRGLPILAPEALPEFWQNCDRPALIAAVGARGARGLIRARLNQIGLQEGVDWWSAA